MVDGQALVDYCIIKFSESTLTLDTLKLLLSNVNWRVVGSWLQIPNSKLEWLDFLLNLNAGRHVGNFFWKNILVLRGGWLHGLWYTVDITKSCKRFKNTSEVAISKLHARYELKLYHAQYNFVCLLQLVKKAVLFPKPFRCRKQDNQLVSEEPCTTAYLVIIISVSSQS